MSEFDRDGGPEPQPAPADAAPAPTGASVDAASPEAVPPSSGARDGYRRLLLVEDDAGDALIVEELLRDAWPELELTHARSIAEAESLLSERPCDCVVLDLGLPDARGLDALARIQDIAPEIAVVVLTGDVDQDRGIAALTAGAQDYLVKGEMGGEGLARAVGYAIQRKLSERTTRELAVLRVQTAANARVQRGLIPHPLLSHEDITVTSRYRPGNLRQVLGGDFFDVVQTEPNCVHVALGDVCGRGPDEATLGVLLRIAWRVLTLAGAAPGRMLEILDRLVVQERHADHVYATLASVRIDLTSGTATAAIAGHPPPILSADGQARLLTPGTGGPPLGLGQGRDWEIVQTPLGTQWTLLLYSDGIYEGRVDGEGPRLGIDAFVDLLGGLARTGSLWDELPDALIGRVETMNGGPLDDDVALLALRCDPRR
ncbi:PP2C family protein-serine/threonine phosphatase [Conexibacter sp. DBS9H8]|uniref:PP2C family protein-serine/threonine phosphatase n=1 Tax=Conexibacter sp. DBS9H8 TaxID=2937801 RepID=UPI00200C6BE7|nr:fused response regulator/phosphatase [Conexibacter sp. DBS9H8]